MTGKIDLNGCLFIHRKGVLIAQICPHNGGVSCGDWCPKFEEPKGQMLTICGGVSMMGIVDARESIRRPAESEDAASEVDPISRETRGGRAGRRRKERSFWIVDGNIWTCPRCMAERDASGFKVNRPRTCGKCKEKLDIPAVAE